MIEPETQARKCREVDHLPEELISPTSGMIQIPGLNPRLDTIQCEETAGGETMVNAAGIPTITMGSGTTRSAHITNEHPEIEDLIDAAKLYRLSIAEWCRAERSLFRVCH